MQKNKPMTSFCLVSKIWKKIIFCVAIRRNANFHEDFAINSLVPNAPFLYPLKTSESRKGYIFMDI